jgi:hypothetical protein
MKELSLHILDIAQNSISAGATLVTIEIKESVKNDSLEISVKDNGCGMSEEFAKNVTDPFTTTRTTRKVGMGIPLFKLAAVQAGGDLSLETKQGVGTKITAAMQHGHIDRSPIGDMAETMVNLVSMNDSIDFVYLHSTDDGEAVLDTRQIREIMQDVPLSNMSVLAWIRDYVNENFSEINARLF